MTHPGPQEGEDDVDARFREIVRGLELGRHPGEGDGAGEAPDGPSREPSASPPPSPHSRSTSDSRDGWRIPDAELLDEDFVPPTPAPLPRDLHFWGIVAGLIGGPLLLLLSAVVPVLPRWGATLGALATVTGFVLLVLRQPGRREDDDPGARV